MKLKPTGMLLIARFFEQLAGKAISTPDSGDESSHYTRLAKDFQKLFDDSNTTENRGRSFLELQLKPIANGVKVIDRWLTQ